MLSAGRQPVLQAGKTFHLTDLLYKIFTKVDDQTKQAKPSSQSVVLPGAQMSLPVVKKIHLPINGESNKVVTGVKIKKIDHSEPKFCPW